MSKPPELQLIKITVWVSTVLPCGLADRGHLLRTRRDVGDQALGSSQGDLNLYLAHHKTASKAPAIVPRVEARPLGSPERDKENQ